MPGRSTEPGKEMVEVREVVIHGDRPKTDDGVRCAATCRKSVQADETQVQGPQGGSMPCPFEE